MYNILMVCSFITGVAGAVGVLVGVFRSMRNIREGQKCLLRQQMLETYYKCRDTGEIRQYRLENFLLSYQAYKALGGNSFIDHIKAEVQEFNVIT